MGSSVFVFLGFVANLASSLQIVFDETQGNTSISRSRIIPKLVNFNGKKPLPNLPKSCEEIPTIEIEEISLMLKSYKAAYVREHVLEALEKEAKMARAKAKYYYAKSQRNCKIAFAAPTKPPLCNGKHTAIIMTGQTRTFLNDKVQKYWKQVMEAIGKANSKPILFAVFDECSVSPPRAGVPLVAHEDSQIVLKKRLNMLAKPQEVIFLSGNGSMMAHASKVKNARLRQILTPWNESDAKNYEGGVTAGYMKWVIGLDMLLNYEHKHKKDCFSHVIHARPDFLFMAWTNPETFRATFKVLTDAAYLVDDVAAIMPREIAGAFFTTIAVYRALHALNSHWGQFLHQKIHTAATGGLLPPALSLAYHGVLFAGIGFDFEGGHLPYSDYDEINNHGGYFVREDLKHGACVDADGASQLLKLPICDFQG